MTGRALLVHADDLSGAAESAALLRMVSPAGTLQLRRGRPAAGLTVIDLDTRHLPEAAAESRARAALENADGLLLTKLDSLLRGNIPAHLRALDPHRRPVVLAPALPTADRTVVDGTLLVHGEPLHRTSHADAWAREATAPPSTVQAALGDVPANLVDLTTVRRGSAEVRQAVAAAAEAGRVAVCDAVTDYDLDLLVSATWDLPGVRYVGAGGLAAALGRRLPRAVQERTEIADARTAGILFVVGTAESAAVRQTAALADATTVACVTVSLRRTLDLASYVARAAAGLRGGGCVVLRAEPVGTAPEVPPSTVAAALSSITAQLVASSTEPLDLMLTGGRTARTVLDALGIDRLTVVDEIHHGAVLLRASDGRQIVTRPGSFGDLSSFVDIHAALRLPHLRKATAS